MRSERHSPLLWGPNFVGTPASLLSLPVRISADNKGFPHHCSCIISVELAVVSSQRLRLDARRAEPLRAGEYISSPGEKHWTLARKKSIWETVRFLLYHNDQCMTNHFYSLSCRQKEMPLPRVSGLATLTNLNDRSCKRCPKYMSHKLPCS